MSTSCPARCLPARRSIKDASCSSRSGVMGIPETRGGKGGGGCPRRLRPGFALGDQAGGVFVQRVASGFGKFVRVDVEADEAERFARVDADGEVEPVPADLVGKPSDF